MMSLHSHAAAVTTCPKCHHEWETKETGVTVCPKCKEWLNREGATSFPIVIARTKLADRPIHWEEKYTPDTAYFHAMYEEIVGPSSYFRFVGTDAETGDEYFAVIGPAKMHDPESKFFAGTRKLPSDFAASGMYFSEIMEAIEHSMETWGLPIPNNTVMHYTSSDLKGLGEKMEKWRTIHSKEQILADFKKPVESDETNDSLDEAEEETDAEASAEGFIREAAGAQPYITRTGSGFWDINKTFRAYTVMGNIDFRPDPFPRRRRKRRDGADYQIPAGVVLTQDQSNPFMFTRSDTNETVDFSTLVNEFYFPKLGVDKKNNRKIRGVDKCMKALIRIAYSKMRMEDSNDEIWQKESKDAPQLRAAVGYGKNDYRKKFLEAAVYYTKKEINPDDLRYILEFGQVDKEGFQTTGHSIGPYLGTLFRRAYHRYGHFRRRLNVQNEEQFMATVRAKFAEICTAYGLDPNTTPIEDVLNVPDQVADGFFAGDPVTIDAEKLENINIVFIERDMENYKDLFVNGFDPGGDDQASKDWEKANKGWKDRTRARQDQMLVKAIRDIYPAETNLPEQEAIVQEIEGLMGSPDKKARNKASRMINTLWLPTHKGEKSIAKTQQPEALKKMARDLAHKIQEAEATGQYINKPPLRIDLNSRFREGLGQLYHSTINRDPVFSIEQADDNSNIVIVGTKVNQADDLLRQDVTLIPGLSVRVSGKRLNETFTSADSSAESFLITSVQPGENGTFVVELNRPVKFRPGWQPFSLKIDMNDDGLTAGIIDGFNGAGNPCKIDFSKDNAILAAELQMTPEDVAELRGSFEGFILGYNNFPQVLKTLELGLGISRGYKADPVIKVYTSRYLEAVHEGHERPQLQDAQPEMNEPVMPAQVGEAVPEAAQGIEPAPEEVPAEPAPVAEGHEAHKPHEPGAVEEAEADKVIAPPVARAKKPNQKELFQSTWNKLVRLAEELDQKGQGKEAKEIHRILRKHQSRLTDFEIRIVGRKE